MSSLVIFGVDIMAAAASINWLLVLYVISSILAVVIGSNRLYSYGMGIATIYAIGSTLVFVLFGYRWFSNPVLPMTWPPNVNMCPDYLTFVKTIGTDGACVDMLGVSTSSLLQMDKSGLSTASPTDRSKVFAYTAKDVSAAKTPADLQPICDRCKEAGVTWEGVYDGDTCVAIKTIDVKNATLASCLAKVQ